MQSVINIIFRGLLVFHQIGTGNTAVMEVGMLPADDHYARIMTIKDGHRVSTKCLFPSPKDTQEDCVSQEPPSEQQVYEIKIDDPVHPGVTEKTNLYQIDRMNPTADMEEDFRWILHFDDTGEFPSHANIGGKLDFSKLKFVIRVPAGQFYAAELSDKSLDLESESSKKHKPFGYIAGIIGCRITIKSGGVGLHKVIWKNAGYVLDPKEVFHFSDNPRYSYEIANSPSDTYTTPGSHFKHYYELFLSGNEPAETYDFKYSEIEIRGPNPALCGEIYLGQSSGSLTNVTAAIGSAQQTRRKKRKSSRPAPVKKHRHH